MTKEEIKALVAAKIAGQGSAIDSASVLPTILDAIVDAIPETQGKSVLVVNLAGFSGKTAEEAAELLGITSSEFQDLHDGYIPSVKENGVGVSYIVIVENDGDKVWFSNADGVGGISAAYTLTYSDGTWTLNDF